jgi:5-(aminomethyl)-3-furanmethanol phosphate kinase
MLEALIRVGGSLSQGDQLPRLCLGLGRLGTRYPLLVVPGGGPFADVVRTEERRYPLANSTAHWMAILAMDQYGYLLSDLIPGSGVVRDLEAAQQVAAAGSVPVLLPFSLLQAADPLPHTWEVTSDSIAAWIASQARIPRLALVKDVDGLFAAEPCAEGGAEPMAVIRLQELARCRGVDGYLATVLAGSGLHLWVLNGNEPDRLGELFEHGRTRGTYCYAAAI